MRWQRDPVLLGVVSAAALAYATLSIVRHETYRSTGFDLGLFDQVVWHLSHLDAPASSLKGLGSIFGDHFSPVLALLAPLLRVWADPKALLVAQAALVAASGIPVYLFAHARLGRRPALLLTVAYLLFGGIQSAVFFDFHEVAFAPLLIALAILLADRERWWWAFLATAALLLVKEDLSFLVIAFGAYYAVLGKRRVGLACAALGLVWYALVTRSIIPSAAGGAGYGYWSYTQLGRDLPHALGAVLQAPWRLVEVAVSPAEKMRTTAFLFGAFLGLTALAPMLLLALPLIAERMLSTHANYWTLQDHYSLTIAPVLAMGAASGLAFLVGRVPALRVRRERAALVATGAMLAIAVAASAAFPLHRLLTPSFYRTPSAYRAADAALAVVPAGASVTATNRLVPHLSERRDVYLLGAGGPMGEYVVADLADDSNEGVFPSAGIGAVRRIVAGLAPRYETVFARDGIVVLRRRAA